jgi:dTDP-4-dehydrorhamnose reductase
VIRVAVTGASGRLGRALVSAAAAAPEAAPEASVAVAIGWSRPDFDLDRPDRFAGLVREARPDVVIHAAAWTDVDGCARDPGLAMRRNGDATAALATACAAAGVDLVAISTNEVFDGRRADGRGYGPADPVGPINAYGESKLAGEVRAREAYAGLARTGSHLSIVRTAWLFGPPGADFPAKILAAAERARAMGEPLRVVLDETGSPTYAADLAAAILRFVADGPRSGTFHVVNAGTASRSAWAREILRLAGLTIPIEEISASSWDRPSRAPRWAVLEHSPDFGPPLRDWRDALAAHLVGIPRAGAGVG